VGTPKKTSSSSPAVTVEHSTAIDPTEARWFRAVADNTIDWESWHGPDGRVLWVNPAVERLTGFSVSKCLAMADYPLPIVAEEDRAHIAVALATAAEQSSGANVDFRIKARDGGLRWMSLSWQPMYAEGKHLGFRTSIRDVTERRELRDRLRLHAEHLEQLVQERTERLYQLERRQRQMEKLAAMGQLAAGVAHEINNPLAGMRNAFELIKSSFSPEHEHYELMELIDKEIERISGITHQMYQLYKRVPQQPSEFTITKTLRDVIAMLAATAEKRRIRINDDTPGGEEARVALAEGEVKQVLYNMIRNAIQASPAGEEVSIRLSADDQNVVITIEDRGPGIPEDVLPRIFDPFFSTKQSGADVGMGLGLSVSRSLLEAMGGRIEVRSAPRRGASFSAIFPRRLNLPSEVCDG